jgi:ERF superfamily
MSAVTEKAESLIVVEEGVRSARQLPTVPADASSLMKIIDRAAMDPTFDVAKLEHLLAVKERWEESEARKAFNVAFADFKSEAVKIVKRTEVKDGPLKGKFHANLFDVVDATTPHLSKHGLAISWKLTKDEPAWMEITCTLRHIGGHSESVSMGGAPDTGPGRNAIQARGSAKSYLERYTATSILGLAAQDADDDGAGSSGLEESVIDGHLTKIDEAKNEASLKKAFAAGWTEAQAVKDKEAMRRLTEAKDARKKELKVAA